MKKQKEKKKINKKKSKKIENKPKINKEGEYVYKVSKWLQVL